MYTKKYIILMSKTALCGTITHHNKNTNQCFTAFWNVLALCKLIGYRAFLSASFDFMVLIFYPASEAGFSFLLLQLIASWC